MRISIVSLVMSFALSAHAQSFDVSAILDHAPSACQPQVSAVSAALNRFGVREARTYSWIVVCDERAWLHIITQERYARAGTQTNTGISDPAFHVVYLNGHGRSPQQLTSTTAHELGHIICKCSDEQGADQAKLLLLSSGAWGRTP